MRVLLVTNDFPPRPGGIQQYLRGLVDHYPHEIRVLAPADHRADSDQRVVRDKRSFMWPTRRVRRWMAGQIEDFAPDVIVFGAPYPLAHLGPRLRRETGVPYAVMTHGAEVNFPAAVPGLRTLVGWPLRRADVVFSVSRFTGARVERFTKRQVRYLGVGVDGSFSPGAQVDAPIVGCVSRFVPRKGQARVLGAVARLRNEGIPATVLLVGAGRNEKMLRRKAAALGVPTRFEISVPFESLPGLYREMAVFAMPCKSRWLGLEVEGLGVVYLEAAATGLPVIAGDSGGSPETVSPGATGFVVDGISTLTDALRRLLSDPDAARQMGAAGQARTAEQFSWNAVIERFLEGITATR